MRSTTPIQAVFYQSELGSEPVRIWLMALNRDQRRKIGEDIRTLQYLWPIGMPKVRKLESDLWELRTRFEAGAARVIFTIHHGKIVLLHGFVKQSTKIPGRELTAAKRRLQSLRS